ncbi:hypothetical protein PENTCL1PPCAC_30471, partial [Pristionchus entomophagus]
MENTLSSTRNVHYHSAKYVRTDANPADHITRGLSANELNDPNHMWWRGAPWMKDPPEKWPNDPIPPTADPPYTRIAESIPTPLIDFERYSTLNKAIKVTGFVLRYIQRSLINSTNTKLKEKFNKIPVSSIRLLTALERTDQFDIWRANTRLDHAVIPSETRSPILIPTSKDSKLARLIIADVHETMFHAGTENVLNQLKQNYWIPRSRQLVKSQVRSCIPCRKSNNLPYSYTATPPLPSDRVSISKPFQSTGIDFIGPFISKENSKITVQIIDSFWSKWHAEYLTTIRDSKKDPDPLHAYRSSSISPKPGAIVLIIDESGNTPRSTWHMAKILSLSGSEATLKLHTGRTIQRPINLLIPLELDAELDPSESNLISNHPIKHSMITRSES